MKKIMLATALASLASASAFAQSLPPSPGTGDNLANSKGRVSSSHKAQSRHAPSAAFGAVTPFGSPAREPSSTGRETAIRDCNAQAAKTYAVRDSNWSVSLYRACMAQYGQPE
jgi:hypothetical protein